MENDNISSQHLGRKGLHLNPKGKARLVLNFLKQIGQFRRLVEHLTESFLSLDLSDKIDHEVLRKSKIFYLSQLKKKILMRPRT